MVCTADHAAKRTLSALAPGACEFRQNWLIDVSLFLVLKMPIVDFARARQEENE